MEEKKHNGMNDRRVREGMLIDVESVLPSVNDHRAVAGSAGVRLSEGSELEFYSGKDVSWSLELTRISGAIAVEGTLEGSFELACYRCLDPFLFSFSVPVREHYLFGSLADEESDEYEVEGGKLDLEPVFRDAIMLSLPLQRVCRSDCPGLCPTCGADLNAGPCDCPSRKVDSRLAPLEELKRRMAGGPEA
jgi:uncharacterized protein